MQCFWESKLWNICCLACWDRKSYTMGRLKLQQAY